MDTVKSLLNGKLSAQWEATEVATSYHATAPFLLEDCNLAVEHLVKSGFSILRRIDDEKYH